MASYAQMIVAFTDEACPSWARPRADDQNPRDCTTGLRCPNKVQRPRSWKTDEMGTYGGTPTHYASYRYVTGRTGNTTRRDLYLCDDCAAAFAKRHGLELAGKVIDLMAALKTSLAGGAP